MIHTVKGFDIINNAEIDGFLEFSCFFNNPVDVGNLICGSGRPCNGVKFSTTRSASISMTGEKRGFSFIKVGKQRKNGIGESENRWVL